MTTVWAGLALGAIYAVVASGYNLGLTAAGVVNFAQAQFLMLGVFIAYWGVVTMGWPEPLVLLVAILILGAVGAVAELVAIRPLAGTGLHGELVTTVGVATLIDGAVVLIWGSEPLRVPFFGPTGSWTVLGGSVRPVDLFLIVGAVLLVAAIFVGTRHTMTGLASLAASENRDAAKVNGIDVGRLSIGAFALSGILGALFALLIGPATFAVATLASALAIKGFVAFAIGGFGSQGGVIVGGFAVGLCEAMSARWIGSEYALLGVFVLLLTVLLLRPQGLFGVQVERQV